MLEMLFGLLGMAVGIGLYRLGFRTARRSPRTQRAPEKNEPSPMGTLSPQELYNFLNYDGGIMDDAKK